MNWQTYISEVLRASSMTQVQLAAELKCGQATVVDILAGRTKSPRGDLALALILFGRKHGLSDPLQESAIDAGPAIAAAEPAPAQEAA